jgi:hypothetical protein
MGVKSGQKLKIAGPWPRFMAFMGDLALGHLLSFVLLSFSSIAEFEKQLIATLSGFAKLFGFAPEMFGFLVYWFLMTMLFRFIHTLFFGVSFFERLAGLDSSGHWWWKRLAGSARVMLDTLMGPLLIFDGRLLLKKATLKEDMTGCFLVKRKKAKDWPLYFFLPFIVLLSCSGPLFKDLMLIDGLVVSFENLEKEDLKPGDNFTNFTSFASERFKFKTFSSLQNGRFSLFPDFEFVKVKKKKRLSPYLLIYDHTNKTTGELKIGYKIALLDLLKRGAYGNPLFARKFPALAEAMAIYNSKSKGGARAYRPRDYTTVNENRLLFNPMVQEDIKKLIQASFELGMNNIVGHILTYGPFLRGFIEVRQALLMLAKPGIKPEVDMITMGNMDFLRFRQIFSDDYPRDKQVSATYLPMGTQNAFTIEMGWDKSLQGALSSKSFRETFLANGEWFFDYENFFKKPRLEAEVTPFYALDLLAEQKTDQPTQEILEEFLYRYYYQKCRKAIQSGDKTMLESLKYNLVRLSSIMKLKEKGEKKNQKFSSLFINQWQELWSSFQAKDRTYFNI